MTLRWRPEDNLALRAARLLQERTRAATAARRCHLRKSIPVAAGLGGGSSDAAAALIGLRRDCGGWSRPCSDLRPLAASLGSDVPFFLTGGTAIAEGRGDVITSSARLSAETIWCCLRRRSRFQTRLPPCMAALLLSQYHGRANGHPRLRACLERGVTPGPEALFNVFESVAFGMHPAIDEGRRAHAGRGRALGEAYRQRPGDVHVRGLSGGGGIDGSAACASPATAHMRPRRWGRS